jgi:putative tryptophan/tyrosine transport system substrate-binding protein
MRRREFLALLGGAVLPPPLKAWAQTSSQKRVGTLGVAAIQEPTQQAFRTGIAQFFSAEIAVEHRWTAGGSATLAELAADLVRSKMDVIFARGPGPLRAARDATESIPIVAIDLESDPLALGFVKTLARPGGNVTGVFMDLPELSGKQVELLKEVLSDLRRVAIIGDPAINGPQFAATGGAAREFAVEPKSIEIHEPGDFERALATAHTLSADACILLSSPVTFSQLPKIAELAIANRLPVISLFAEFPRGGGFMAYGPSLQESFRRCGAYVGKILQGANPGELPIERPERFELVINLKTAKLLGLSVPPPLLARADEVIE